MLLILLLLLAFPLGAFGQARESHKLVVFGDLQRSHGMDDVLAGEYDWHAVQRMDGLIATVNWLRDNRATQNIQAVLQVGDFIDHECDGTIDAACGGNTNGNDTCNRLQWGRAMSTVYGPRSSFTYIDPTTCDNCDGSLPADPLRDCDDTSSLEDDTLGLASIRGLPIIVDRGNHEDADNGVHSYEGLLGPTYYSGAPVTMESGIVNRYLAPETYLGSFKDGNAAADAGTAHAFLIVLGDRRVLVITVPFAFEIAESEGTWVLALMRARRHLPVILVTHDEVNTGSPGDQVANNDIVTSALDSEPNLRMIFGGHWGDTAVDGSNGAVGVQTDTLQVFINYQNVNPDGNGGGCVATVTYDGAARTIDYAVDGPAGLDFGACNPALGAIREWDQEIPSTVSFNFDPAPCNERMVDRVGRVRRVHGCG